MFKQKLQEDLRKSMLAKDEVRTSTLRMLISAIGYYEIQEGGAGYEAKDEDVIEVLGREIKKHRESIKMYQKGNRPELAKKENNELKILQKYLPEQISEDEVKNFVKEAIVQTGAKTITDMGKVMGALMPKVKGKADGSLVSKIVKEELSN
ncbi:MAG: hypothetical protein A2857_05745 [Candidatus Levybacteria bacterium RIFCSPHIGHO2_01_FULL_36_15]|nr:MAG: hypothetical protein A2857_05745 [Candidatus Levybacteria bacterium RIFCSPHIGHO2_01_FULL_36_15]